MKDLVIIGTGGLGRETYDAAIDSTGYNTDFRVKGFIKDATYKEIENFNEYFPEGILGTIDDYEIRENDVFFCALGDTALKMRFVEQIKARGGKFFNLLDSRALIPRHVRLGEGVRIAAFSSISNNVSIGNHTTLLTSVVVGHDVVIGEYCQLGTFAHFGGHASIGSRSTVHPGAIVLPRVSIAEDTVIGVGSVIVRRIKLPHQTWFGNPAKRLF